MNRRDWLDLVYWLSYHKLTNTDFNKLTEIYNLQSVDYAHKKYTQNDLDKLFSVLADELRNNKEDK